MYDDNHTYKDHGMTHYPRDTHHDLEQAKSIPGYIEDYLIFNCECRPWYSKKMPYIVSAMFGMSWFTRQQFMENTSYAKFDLNKRIES